MGIVYVEGTVTGPTGKETTTEFLVDSGGQIHLATLEELESDWAKACPAAHFCPRGRD